MESSAPHTDKSIIFFDGVCNLCEGFVQWIIRRDPKEHFQFASLQSDFTKSFFISKGEKLEDLHTVILYKAGKFYSESDVTFEVINQLGFPWSWLYPFKLIPRIIRDKVYRWVASNRYQWFGKKDACMIPTPALQNRFLD